MTTTPASTQSDAKTIRLLIVDDQVEYTHLLEEEIRDHDTKRLLGTECECVKFYDFDAAEEHLTGLSTSEVLYKLAIIDVDLPNRDNAEYRGFRLSKLIREKWNGSLRCLVVTALGEKVHLLICEDYDFDKADIELAIEKPAVPSELARIILEKIVS